MERWRGRAYLMVLGALAIAAGIAEPFLPQAEVRHVFGTVAILGGLAMLVVAVMGLGNGKNGNGGNHK